jgi:hypothetical protein
MQGLDVAEDGLGLPPLALQFLSDGIDAGKVNIRENVEP